MKPILLFLLLFTTAYAISQPVIETKANGKTTFSMNVDYEDKTASKLYEAYFASLNSEYGVKVKASDKFVKDKWYTNTRRDVFQNASSSPEKEMEFKYTLLFNDGKITYQMTDVQYYIGKQQTQYAYDDFMDKKPLTVPSDEMYGYKIQPYMMLREWSRVVDRNIRELLKMNRSMDLETEIRIDEPVERDEKPVATDPNRIYNIAEVEVMPSFPGGHTAMESHFKKNLSYTPEMKETGYYARILLTFVVEKDGALRDIKVVRNLCPACDAEVVRVLKMVPKWIPARIGNKPVRTSMAIPVMFIAR